MKAGIKRNWSRIDVVIALILIAGGWFLTDTLRSGEFYFRTIAIQESQSPVIFWLLSTCFLILLIGIAILLFFYDLNKFFGQDNDQNGRSEK